MAIWVRAIMMATSYYKSEFPALSLEFLLQSDLAADVFCPPEQQRRAENNPVNREHGEAVLAHPVKEPLDDTQSHDEGDDEADEEHDPVFGSHDDVGGNAVAGEDFLFQVPESGCDHGGNGEQETELEGCGAVESGDLAGGDGGHRTRGSGEDGRERLAEADPDGLEERHFFQIGR